MSSSPAICLCFSVVLLATTLSAAAHNITEILAAFPEYAVYNRYLSQTKISDEINSRQTVTVLVLPNAAMTALADKKPVAGVKNALRLLTLLDYYDSAKLHKISQGTVLTTTLLQTTGKFQGNLGFVNITDLKGGKVGFGSTSHGAHLETTYTKSVKQIEFSISVLEVSAPILFPGLLDAPAANMTESLDKAGCKTFAHLLDSSGVLKMYKDAMDKGLTVFAPTDEAFKAHGVPDLSTLTQLQLVTLLQYHAVPQYTPKSSLKTTKLKLPTLATNSVGNYTLGVTSSGDDVSIVTGLDTSRVANTVIDRTPLCVLSVDNLLLPSEMFGAAPAPGPVGTSPAPAPASEVATAPSPGLDFASPPASEETPSGAPESPAGAPEEEETEADARASDGKTLTMRSAEGLFWLFSFWFTLSF